MTFHLELFGTKLPDHRHPILPEFPSSVHRGQVVKRPLDMFKVAENVSEFPAVVTVGAGSQSSVHAGGLLKRPCFRDRRADALRSRTVPSSPRALVVRPVLSSPTVHAAAHRACASSTVKPAGQRKLTCFGSSRPSRFFKDDDAVRLLPQVRGDDRGMRAGTDLVTPANFAEVDATGDDSLHVFSAARMRGSWPSPVEMIGQLRPGCSPGPEGEQLLYERGVRVRFEPATGVGFLLVAEGRRSEMTAAVPDGFRFDRFPVFAENVMFPVGHREQDSEQQASSGGRGVESFLAQKVFAVLEEQFDIFGGFPPVAAKPADFPDDEGVCFPGQNAGHSSPELWAFPRFAGLVLVGERVNEFVLVECGGSLNALALDVEGVVAGSGSAADGRDAHVSDGFAHGASTLPNTERMVEMIYECVEVLGVPALEGRLSQYGPVSHGLQGIDRLRLVGHAGTEGER